MNREQFHQQLVAALIAHRIARERAVPLLDVDQRWVDKALALCAPVEEARRNARVALWEWLANVPPDQQERLMPAAVDCARMIDGEVYEANFRTMLRNWTAPESAEFRQAVLADLNNPDDWKEEPK